MELYNVAPNAGLLLGKLPGGAKVIKKFIKTKTSVTTVVADLPVFEGS